MKAKGFLNILKINIILSLTITFNLMIYSCGKGVFGPARVDGIVNDATTGDPVYNAKVYLLERENSFDFFGPIPASIVIDSSVTGALGRFEFTYDDRPGYIYSVYAMKLHYIDNYNVEDILNLGSGTDVEVLISPEAFLKVRIHNVNTYGSMDCIAINGLNDGPYYGNNVDTIEIKRVTGNSITSLHVFIFDDGVISESIEHNIYCPAFDTTYYEILY